MKTIKILSMAVLALVGAALTSCSKDDSSINDNPEQPTNPKNIVTLTTTISRDADDPTSRALTPAGVKTFAVGETMAVVYNNGTSTVKATSRALTAGDITNEGKSATFTFELETPNKSEDVTYIYPAAMANDGGSVNYAALNSQDGLLSTLASNLDLATCTAAWNSGNLPNCTLNNQLAILAITLKNNDGSNEITDDITGLTLSDGSNSYSVSRSAAEGPIYVAIRPTDSTPIWVYATDGSTDYTKFLQSKTYEANNGYPVSWRMIVPSLAKTLTTAGMSVKVNYNYNSGSNCLYVSNGDGTYSFVSGSGWVIEKGNGAHALVVEDGKLVFKQNFHSTLEYQWDIFGFSVTFNTSDDTYSQWAGVNFDPYFISVEVNGKEMALTPASPPKITVNDLVKEEGMSWGDIVRENSDKIYVDGETIKRTSDNALLLELHEDEEDGDWWGTVYEEDPYFDDVTYKFEGD